MPSYPLETRPLEIQRQLVQSEAMAPDARILLGLIGVQAHWRCLDLGCGPAGIANLLSPLAGRVTGLDRNTVFLEHARRDAPPNVEFLEGDAYRTGLPDASFHLTHMRFLASTAGDPERLLAEAWRVTRPGGVIALQEPDGRTLDCYPPHPSWDALKAALLGAFAASGSDLTLARRLYPLAYHSGLEDVQYRTSLLGVRSGDPMTDYLPSTVESLRGAIVGAGLLSADELDRAVSECRAHLRQPGVGFTMYAVAQVWGRKPAGD